MRLSVIIPAHNESGSLPATLSDLVAVLRLAHIEFEIVVVEDHSTDATGEVLRGLSEKFPEVKATRNGGGKGFGWAVRWGLNCAAGDALAIFMADGSDDPRDLVRFFATLQREAVDCVFGTRFSRASKVSGYPIHKLILNRIVNKAIQLMFVMHYNDTTNAFKLYRREVIEGLQPLISPHFNLTVELPLKAIVRGYRYVVLPNNWRGRREGKSNLKIKEMGSRYLFIILYCFIEKWLSRGDYARTLKKKE